MAGFELFTGERFLTAFYEKLIMFILDHPVRHDMVSYQKHFLGMSHFRNSKHQF